MQWGCRSQRESPDRNAGLGRSWTQRRFVDWLIDVARFPMRYALTAIALVGVIAVAWFLYAQKTPAPRIGNNSKERVMKTDAEWKKELTPEQYQVTRRKGTERAFSGKYAYTK